MLPSNRPNDNFDYYKVSIEKQGGPEIQIPIFGPDFDPMNPCFYGVQRVGDPLNHVRTVSATRTTCRREPSSARWRNSTCGHSIPSAPVR